MEFWAIVPPKKASKSTSSGEGAKIMFFGENPPLHLERCRDYILAIQLKFIYLLALSVS